MPQRMRTQVGQTLADIAGTHPAVAPVLAPIRPNLGARRALVALSHFESELYLVVGASADGILIQPAPRDVNRRVRVNVLLGASVALGAVSFRGIGGARCSNTSNLICGCTSLRRTNGFRAARCQVTPTHRL